MKKPEHHLLVCASFRLGGEAQGVCQKKGSASHLGYLQSELADRGLDQVTVSATGCLNVCDRGPAMIVYPQGDWYGNLGSSDAIDAVLDAIESGTPCAKHLLT